MTINLVIQPHLPVIILITAMIAVFVFIAYGKLKKFDPLDEPKGLVLLCIMLVEWIDGMVKEIVSEDWVEKLGPFIGSIAAYILLANYIGLLGFDNPTLNLSCTLAITLVCWILFQATDIKYKGAGGYIKSYFQPIFLFVISNVFSALAPLISMSMRLFGNILSGSIIMSLMYSATGALSAKLFPFLGGIDIIGPIFGSVLHLYFDLFSGFLQMYLFIMLTMVFIGTRIPDEVKNKSLTQKKEGE
ncbi:MAG: F0F1 ATP synthase subunit A [Erysipelotrichaceae bacterium]|nr:F0F1 ATP synthase subunit A [Erysipelotrichaceae bacterium]